MKTHTFFYSILILIIGFQLEGLSQNFEWGTHVDIINLDNIASGGNSVLDIATDSQGDIYIAGHFAGTAKFGDQEVTSAQVAGVVYSDDGFIAKYSSDGIFQWVEVLPSVGLVATVVDIEIDNANNIYVLANFTDDITIAGTNINSNDNNEEGFAIAKLDADRNLLWVNSTFEANAWQRASGSSLTLGNNGEVYIAGLFYGEITIGGIFLDAEMSPGVKGFTASFDTETGDGNWGAIISSEAPEAMVSDNDGNLFITGKASSAFGTAPFGGVDLDTEGSSVVYLTKYDGSGNFLWKKHSSTSYLHAATGLDIDIHTPSGDLYISGSGGNDTLAFDNIILFPPGLAGNHLFILKYNADGEIQWAKTNQQGTANYVQNSEMEVVNDGSFFIGGEYGSAQGGGIILGEGGNSILLDGDNDPLINSFIAKYTAEGVLDWAKKVGDTGQSQEVTMKGMKMVGPDQVVFTGNFEGTIQMGDSTLTAVYPGTVAKLNMFLAKCDGDLGTSVKDQDLTSSAFNIYPNPSAGSINLVIPENSPEMCYGEIVDLNGAIIFKFKIDQHQTAINLQEIPSGIYYMRLKGEGFWGHEKLIIESRF